MAKSKKKISSTQAAKPVARVAPVATTTITNDVECHVSATVSPKKGSTDSVDLVLSYFNGVTVDTVGEHMPLPAVAAQATAVSTPPPAEPAAPPAPVVSASNATAPEHFVQDTAQGAAAVPVASLPVKKSSFLPPNIRSSFGRYFELAVQAYTYPAYYSAGAAVGVATAVAAEVTRYVPFLSRSAA